MGALPDPRAERFAELVVGGEKLTDAYIAAYAKHAVRRRQVSTQASALADRPEVKLRIEELRKPVIAKVQKKFQYGIEQALEEIAAAQQTARALGQPATELKAIELKAKITRLLGIGSSTAQTEGALAGLSTDDLLEMQTILRERKALRDAAGADPKIVKLARKAQ